MSTKTETKPAVDEAAKMREAVAGVARRMDERVKVFAQESKDASHTSYAFAVATCMKDLRAIMNVRECVALLRTLAGTPMGFLADKPSKTDQTPYDDATLLSCACEALVRGYRLTGNEWNLIAGRFYAAKNGLQRKVFSLEGLDGFFPDYTVPVKGPNGDSRMFVTGKAKFTFRGRPVVIERTFGVNGTPDAAAGKAERRFLAAVLMALTNISEPVGGEAEELEEAETVPAESKASGMVGKLTGQADKTADPPKELPEAKKTGGSIFDAISDSVKEKEYELAQRKEEQRRAHEATR